MRRGDYTLYVVAGSFHRVHVAPARDDFTFAVTLGRKCVHSGRCKSAKAARASALEYLNQQPNLPPPGA